ncbi:MAG TPA: glycoside hydrolase family 88 protein [Polyangiaceae bacterium]|nr:glycoside hydrolase family 88 protein [Polyangiaceae bacterium]
MTSFRGQRLEEFRFSLAFLLAIATASSGCGTGAASEPGGAVAGTSSAGAGATASTAGVSGGVATAGATSGGSGGASAGSAAQAGSAPLGGSETGISGSGGVSNGGVSSGGVSAAGAGAGGMPAAPDVAFCSKALDAAALQYAGFRAAYTNPASVPRSAKDGVVANVGIGDWTFGFVGGSYWYLYEHTQDQAFRTAAEATTAALEAEKTVKTTHDLGFQFMATYGNGYRLTNNASYLAILQTAASSLATRFHATVGCVKSWDRVQYDYPVIIDNMMNLHLLYFTAANGGDAAFADDATTHAETTLKNHFRADNSSYHLVNYNSATGAVIAKLTVQGLADSSAWARGQSWGLYGYTESFVASKKPEFLAQAQKIAAFLMTHKNMPADKVPYWDYDAPDTPGTPTPRDASAAAVMASGLLQLAGLVQEPAASSYRNFALDILKSLSSPAYAAAVGTNSHFLLMHSTGYLSANIEIDAAINYADYYYLEALLRCRALAAP